MSRSAAPRGERRAAGGQAPRPATPGRAAPVPRLCVVGALVGRNPGCVTSQGEILADGLAAAGFPVLAVSARAGRYARLADIVATLHRRRREIDVVILQVYGGPSFVVEDAASALARAAGHRVVAHLHGGALPTFLGRWPRWGRRVLRRAHALVAPSPYLVDAVAAHGFEARVIPNALDLAASPFRLRTAVEPRLFWMRSFHPLYNPLLAVRVLARVRAVHPRATLTMGGQDKGMLAAVRAEAARLGVTDGVRLVGFLDAEGKRREAAAADVFLNTNRVDNTPVAVLEAGAFGLPVVATAVGGVPRLLRDGHDGLLVPDDDAPAMADAVLRLVREPALAAHLSANGRRLAEGSAWPAVRVAWERLLTGLAAGRR